VGDILIEVSGGSKEQPTGRSLFLSQNLLDRFDCPVVPASFCRLMRPINTNIGILLSQHLKYIYATGKTWEYQNQSTGIANFQTTHFLENELVLVPTENVLIAFTEAVEVYINKTHAMQIETLTSLRDTLLPLLISGPISVNDAAPESLIA
jgi:type I restriction enzyme S subunit